MRPITVTVGPLASGSANSIATSQSAAGAQALTLNGSTATGGVATLDKPRQVLITSAGNDSGITFTITGTDWSGLRISEVVTGANASTAVSALDYRTVSNIKTSGASASTLTVGTNAIAGSSWVNLDSFGLARVTLQCVAVGTVNYTVQQTMDDPNSFTNPVARSAVTWASSGDTAVVAATASQMSFFQYAPRWVRVLLNSGTGSVIMTLNQDGGIGL